MGRLSAGQVVVVFGRLVNGSLRERAMHNGCYLPAEFFTLPAGTLLRAQCHWLIPFSDFTERIVVQFQHKAVRYGDRSQKLKLYRVSLDQTDPIPNPS